MNATHLFAACLGAAVASWTIYAIARYRIARTVTNGSVIPANTRLVSSDGETFFTTRKALVIGGFVTVPVRKDPLQ
jgi:hypothetical protein